MRVWAALVVFGRADGWMYAKTTRPIRRLRQRYAVGPPAPATDSSGAAAFGERDRGRFRPREPGHRPPGRAAVPPLPRPGRRRRGADRGDLDDRRHQPAADPGGLQQGAVRPGRAEHPPAGHPGRHHGRCPDRQRRDRHPAGLRPPESGRWSCATFATGSTRTCRRSPWRSSPAPRPARSSPGSPTTWVVSSRSSRRPPRPSWPTSSSSCPPSSRW